MLLSIEFIAVATTVVIELYNYRMSLQEKAKHHHGKVHIFADLKLYINTMLHEF